MKKLLVAGTIALAAMVAMPQTASAVPFTGQVEYSGLHTPNTGSFLTATQVSIDAAGVLLATGSFSPSMSTFDPLVHATPIILNPLTIPGPPLWTHASGISFTLTSIGVTGTTSANTLALAGSGFFSGPANDDTDGIWNMTLNIETGNVQGSFSSSSTVPPVPEPGLLALFGLGLLGVARRYTR